MKRLNSIELESCNWLKSPRTGPVILAIAIAVVTSLVALKGGPASYIAMPFVGIPCVIGVVHNIKSCSIVSNAIKEGNVFIGILPVLHYNPTYQYARKKTEHCKLTVLLDGEEFEADVMGHEVIIVDGKADVLIFRSGENKYCYAISPIIDRLPKSIIESVYALRGIKEEDFIDDSGRKYDNDLNGGDDTEEEL